MDRSGFHDKTERLKNALSSPVVKRSVKLAGHATSVSLEKPFWDALQKIADHKSCSINTLITEIDELRSVNLSSAIRLYILQHLTQ